MLSISNTNRSHDRAIFVVFLSLEGQQSRAAVAIKDWIQGASEILSNRQALIVGVTKITLPITWRHPGVVFLVSNLSY